MRKLIDLVLTLNLFAIILVGAYFWLEGSLIIEFQHEAAVAEMQTDAVAIFSSTLRAEVDRTLGAQTEGYEPYMFLAVFPGLVATDFKGVLANTGSYDIVGGELVHGFAQGDLRHEGAKTVSYQGMGVLLNNVAERTGVDLEKNGTITKIMTAISSK